MIFKAEEKLSFNNLIKESQLNKRNYYSEKFKFDFIQNHSLKNV